MPERQDFVILRGVTKRFSETVALKNINLTIKSGERFGILGRSGAGKSVLMHMLRGMKGYEPTEGQVIYRVAFCPRCKWVDLPDYAGKRCPHCGASLELREVDFWREMESDVGKAIRRRIAIMFQRTFALYGSFSAMENIIEALRRAGVDERLITSKAIELLRRVKLTHRALHPARDLSGGEKQRVVLARQLALNPMLLLADEPTGTLDPQNALEIQRTLLEESTNNNITLVVTSHIPEAVAKITERAVWLENGEVKVIGPSSDIVSSFMAELGKKVLEERPVIEAGGPIVKLKSVKKYYFSIERGVVRAVDGVDLEINENQIFGIVGVSGSGKTTLARIIAGITEPTSGEVHVRIGDEWVNILEPGPSGKGRATAYIGLLHQEYSLYPHRSVLENLTTAIGLSLPDEFAHFKAVQTLLALGFTEEEAERIINRYPDELSEGERHRVAIAQVLIREPRIVILDEPSGTMDPYTRIEVANSLKKARAELGQTFIIVSHDMDFVLRTCEVAALMRTGKIVKIGDPSEIVKELTPVEAEEMLNQMAH